MGILSLILQYSIYFLFGLIILSRFKLDKIRFEESIFTGIVSFTFIQYLLSVISGLKLSIISLILIGIIPVYIIIFRKHLIKNIKNLKFNNIILVFSLIILSINLFTYISKTGIYYWDEFTFWGTTSKLLYQFDDIIRNSTQGFTVVPDYTLFFPLLSSFTFFLSGGVNESFARAHPLILLIITISFIYSILLKKHNKINGFILIIILYFIIIKDNFTRSFDSFYGDGIVMITQFLTFYFTFKFIRSDFKSKNSIIFLNVFNLFLLFTKFVSISFIALNYGFIGLFLLINRKKFIKKTKNIILSSLSLIVFLLIYKYHLISEDIITQSYFHPIEPYYKTTIKNIIGKLCIVKRPEFITLMSSKNFIQDLFLIIKTKGIFFIIFSIRLWIILIGINTIYFFYNLIKKKIDNFSYTIFYLLYHIVFLFFCYCCIFKEAEGSVAFDFQRYYSHIAITGILSSLIFLNTIITNIINKFKPLFNKQKNVDIKL